MHALYFKNRKILRVRSNCSSAACFPPVPNFSCAAEEAAARRGQMLEISLPKDNPRLDELQQSLLLAQHDPGTVPNESVLSGHSARNRAALQVLHPGGSLTGSVGRGSIGRLSRFSTTAGDALSRKAHVVSLVANTALLLGKSYVYWQSQSMAILASLIDSAVDMVAQGVLMVANRIVTDRRDEQNVRYPAGRSKLESIGVAAWPCPGPRQSRPPTARGALALARGVPAALEHSHGLPGLAVQPWSPSKCAKDAGFTRVTPARRGGVRLRDGDGGGAGDTIGGERAARAGAPARGGPATSWSQPANPCSQPAHPIQPACPSQRPPCPPNVPKVGLLDMLIMSSTTFIKLGLWAWCSSIVNGASAALEPEGGCGVSGWACGAVGGRAGCSSHRVGAEARLRRSSGAGPTVADSTAFERT